MQKRMTYLGEKQAVISNNIANADTPDYIPKTIQAQTFEDQLGNQLKMAQTDNQHLSSGAMEPVYRVMDQKNVQLKPNGNGVNIEQEAFKMMQNQGDYSLTTNLYSRTNTMMRYAISGDNG